MTSVKQLEWNEHSKADVYSVNKSFGQGPKRYFLARGDKIIDWYDHDDEAKAAAQADYETRILSALTNASLINGSGLRSHVGHSLDNDTWFVRIYPFSNEEKAKEAQSALMARSSALTNTSGDDEAVKPLLGTRFKLNFNKAGNCTNFYRSQAEELEGQWVWLIDATDGMNNPVYARPQSAAVRDGWKPIETAPKDGTSIVGYGADYVGYAVAHVTRHVGFVPGSLGYAEGRKDTWWEYVERHTCFHWEPTHWMPLPAAPAIRSTQEG